MAETGTEPEARAGPDARCGQARPGEAGTVMVPGVPERRRSAARCRKPELTPVTMTDGDTGGPRPARRAGNESGVIAACASKLPGPGVMPGRRKWRTPSAPGMAGARPPGPRKRVESP